MTRHRTVEVQMMMPPAPCRQCLEALSLPPVSAIVVVVVVVLNRVLLPLIAT